MAGHGCDVEAERRLGMNDNLILKAPRGATSVRGTQFSRVPACLTCLLAAVALMGCSKTVEQAGPPGEVVSSTPNRDRAAYIASDEALSEVHYGVIEKKGPKGVPQVFDSKPKNPAPGEQADAEKRRYRARVGATGTEDSSAATPLTPEPAAPAAAAAAATPTTQPVSPAAQAAAMPEFSEANLPVQVIYLPENKVRIIWE